MSHKNAKMCILSVVHGKIVRLISSKVASASKRVQLRRHC
jgi:hypothetical protein